VELRQITAARQVDIEVLILEQVDGDRPLRRVAEQIEQDEELAVMHADFGDAALYAKRALAFTERGDCDRGLGVKPAFDVEFATVDVTFDA